MWSTLIYVQLNIRNTKKDRKVNHKQVGVAIYPYHTKEILDWIPDQEKILK